MVHILLLILKIIGIIVLSILGLALLILFFPIAYVGKVNGNIEEKKITGNIRAGWLFHLLHCRLWIENTEIHYNIRLLGIKIKSSETKEKKKKEKRKNQSEEQSQKNEEEKTQDELKEDSVKKNDIKQIGTSENEKVQEIQNSNLEETDVKNQNNENIKSEDSKKTTETNNRKKEKKSFITRMQISFKKLKQRIKKIVKNIKDKIHNIKENAKNKKNSIDEIINQIKTVKQFVTSKTTKEAYAYGKKMVLKLLKHLAPNRIKGNLYMGFEESLIRNAAPTLAGIKTANLYNFRFKNLRECIESIHRMNKRLNQKGIYIKLMKNVKDFYLLYVYRKSKLEERIADPEVHTFLQNYGYKDSGNLASYIEKLKERINTEPCFPHEIGVFLGYPIEDVRDFIEKKGEGCAYCGEWKVYHDVPAAISFFCKLKKCRDVYARVYEDGRNIYDMTVRA